jgi:hypothetical protein
VVTQSGAAGLKPELGMRNLLLVKRDSSLRSE